MKSNFTSKYHTWKWNYKKFF